MKQIKCCPLPYSLPSWSSSSLTENMWGQCEF